MLHRCPVTGRDSRSRCSCVLQVEIAKQYLLPRARDDTGLNENHVLIEDAAMRALIRGYAREAGVRNLSQQLEKIHRKAHHEPIMNHAPFGPNPLVLQFGTP